MCSEANLSKKGKKERDYYKRVEKEQHIGDLEKLRQRDIFVDSVMKLYFCSGNEVTFERILIAIILGMSRQK